MSIVQSEEIVLPSSPDDRKAIFDAIKEVSNSKTRMEAERDYQKDTFKMLEENFNIKAKYFRRMAKDYHKQQFKKSMDENDAYSDLYTTIIPD